MRSARLPILAASAVTLAVLLGSPAATAEWSVWRGPGHSGSIVAPGTFPDGPFSLEIAWSTPLGSSYASVAVSGGRAFTMFADGDDDLLVALDAASGGEQWRHRIGPLTSGHDGSDDGPLSTPVVAGGRVFALSATGELIAVEADDGRELWRVPLAERRKAEAPYFGFATTPLPVDDLIVVQLGGKNGKALTALAASDGATRWTAAAGETVYQSPVLVTLGGRRQIVAALKTRTVGLDPVRGKELWSIDSGSAPTATPVPVGSDRLLVAGREGLTMVRVEAADGGAWHATSLWVADTLKADNAMPVVVGEHIYGFNGNFLTALALADGSRVWRSRPPGGNGIIAVDGRLAIHDAGGRFVIVEATPEGYRERASVAVGKNASFTWPTFAGGLFFVRDLERVTAIRVGRPSKPVAPAQTRPRS